MRHYILEYKMEQKLKSQKLKAISRQRETNNLFWKAIKSQVTNEVVKLNLEKDQLTADLVAFGKPQ